MVADLLEGQGIDIVRSFSTESHVDLLVPSHQAIRAVALIDGLARELADPTWRRA